MQRYATVPSASVSRLVWPGFDTAAILSPGWAANTYSEWISGIDSHFDDELTDGSIDKADLGVCSDGSAHVYAYRAGSGGVGVLLVGGMHGEEMLGQHAALRWFESFVRSSDAGLALMRDRLTVTWVPTANPYGYRAYPGSPNAPGRMNANGVDLNRNFDYHWDEFVPEVPEQNKGTAVFSEPESQMLRDLVLDRGITVAIDCHNFGPTPSELQYVPAAQGGPLASLADTSWTERYGTPAGYGAQPVDRGPIPSLANWVTGLGRESVIIEIDYTAKSSVGGQFRHNSTSAAVTLYAGFISEFLRHTLHRA